MTLRPWIQAALALLILFAAIAIAQNFTGDFYR